MSSHPLLTPTLWSILPSQALQNGLSEAQGTALYRAFNTASLPPGCSPRSLPLKDSTEKASKPLVSSAGYLQAAYSSLRTPTPLSSLVNHNLFCHMCKLPPQSAQKHPILPYLIKVNSGQKPCKINKWKKTKLAKRKPWNTENPSLLTNRHPQSTKANKEFFS